MMSASILKAAAELVVRSLLNFAIPTTIHWKSIGALTKSAAMAACDLLTSGMGLNPLRKQSHTRYLDRIPTSCGDPR